MDLIQSFIFTTARHNLTLYEQRILLCVVDAAQGVFRGKFLKENLRQLEHHLENVPVEVQVSALLPDGSNHYELVINAARSLMQKQIEYYDTKTKTFFLSPVIYNLTLEKGSGKVRFYTSRRVFDAVVDLTKGYSAYELEKAMQLPSPYALRFYILMNSQTQPLTISVDDLRKMFGLEDKYKLNADFIKRVVDSSKKVLDESKYNSFNYEKVIEGKKITALRFIPLRKVVLTADNLDKRAPLSQVVGRQLLGVMCTVFGFTLRELAPHKIVLRKFAMLPYWLTSINRISKRWQKGAKNKGYIIAAIKSEVAQFEAQNGDPRKIFKEVQER